MEKDYLKDITEIKEMMNRSSQFLSLSGLSGVLAGIYALIGAYIANSLLEKHLANSYENPNDISGFAEMDIFLKMIGLAFVVLLMSILTGIVLSHRKAKKQGQHFWNSTSKRLVVNFSIPLAIGGLFSLVILYKAYYDLIVPLTLIFYGISCIQASKYTFRDVRYLGFILSFLGILAAWFTEHSVALWALGFGVFHIIYGMMMYVKYDRNA